LSFFNGAAIDGHTVKVAGGVSNQIAPQIQPIPAPEAV
jgi:hypothetical protein